MMRLSFLKIIRRITSRLAVLWMWPALVCEVLLVRLALAFVVSDKIDEQVNTRAQGRTYIIESVAPLITLKSGTSFICIKYEGAA